MRTYKIHLIRHALTEANLKGQYVGVTDIPICSQGIQELKELKEKFEYPKAEKYFRSPLLRCKQTLDILYPDVQSTAIDGLHERNFGDFEGKTAQQLQHDSRFAKWLASSAVDAPPNGESILQFKDRICDSFENLMDYLISNGIHSAVIVAHGGTIMGILASYGLPRAHYLDWAVGNGRGYTISITPSLWMRDKVAEVVAPLPIGATPTISEQQKKLYDSVRKAVKDTYGKEQK